MNSKMAGQTINDRLLAARHSLAGQGLAKSVCKATTEEMIGPKKKHLDYLVQCTNEPNVSIPQLANLLIERSQNTNWVVVYKSLITVHHMMCYGNERFTQYLASSNSSFQLSNFLDKSGLQGYDMSPFIRRYARYLNEKALSYRTVAFDFCKVKRGKEDGTLRTMNAEKLLKTLPSLQNQLDALLEFDCSANNLTNGVINNCFMLLFRDLIRLFACYNDGVINLLEKFFDMNKKQCREALDLYKKFLIRMDRVGEFLKVAENVGIDKGDIPDLTKAPSSLLDALEQHLAAIEGKKSTTTTPTQNASNQRNIKSGVSALSSTSSSFGTAATNGRLENNGIDESLKQQILAEEEAAMNQYKSKLQSPNSATNPFLNSPPGVSAAPIDLFAPPVKESTKASEDLLQLNNPFADVFTAQPTQSVHMQSNMWLMKNGNGYAQPQPAVPPTNFVSESNFNSVFGITESSAAKDPDVCGSTALLNPFLTNFQEPQLLDQPQAAAESQPTPIIDLLANDIPQDKKLDTVLPPVPSPIQPSNTPASKDVFGIGGRDYIKETKIENIHSTILPDVTQQMNESLFDMTDDISSEPVIKPKAVPPPRPPPPAVKANIDTTVDVQTISHNIEKMSSIDSILPAQSSISSDECIGSISEVNMAGIMSVPAPNMADSKSSSFDMPAIFPTQFNMPDMKLVQENISIQHTLPKQPEDNISGNIPLADLTPTQSLSSQPNMPSLISVQGMMPNNSNIPMGMLATQGMIPGAVMSGQVQTAGQIDGFDGLGGVLQPATSQDNSANTNHKSAHQTQGSALLTGDLESSLASLAENLSINSRPPPVKGVQWNSPKNGAKTGSSWTPQPMAATTGAGYRPMGQGMTTLPAQPMYPQMQPMVGMRPMPAGSAMMAPISAIPPTNPTMAQQHSLLFH